MADPTRYWGDRDRPRFGERSGHRGEPRGRDHGSDGGYIARHGFGNPRSGYGPEAREGGDWGYPRDERERGYRGRGYGAPDYREARDRLRGRDYGDAAGYGRGGSWRDFRDVTGRDWDDERFRHPDDFFRGDERGFFERAGDEIASWFGDDAAARRREDDARGERGGFGQHRGRGPKNYRRTDERIREDVSDRLMEDPHIDASDIEVGVANGEVVLTGTVDSRFAKRHAEDLAEDVSGVTHVQNNLRVRRENEGSAGDDRGDAGRDDGMVELGRGSEGSVTGRVGRTSTPRRRRGPVLE